MHILIIEDEEQLCRSMAEGLRMADTKQIPALTEKRDWNYV